MAVNDNYEMNLLDSEDANKSSVRSLTDEEKVQMQKLRKQIRKELGIEDEVIDTTYVRSKPQPEPEQAETSSVTTTTQVEEDEQSNANNFEEQSQEAGEQSEQQTVDSQLAEQEQAEIQQQTVSEPQEIGDDLSVDDFEEDNSAKNETDSENSEQLQSKESASSSVDNHAEIKQETASGEQSELDEVAQGEAAVDFFEKYKSKKEDLDISTYGKYDSDLDFKLNRKIKKIRLPMPKGMRAMVACLVMVILAASVVGVALWLYKPAEKIVLKSVVLSQPIVSDVYVGDRLSYDNLYINCTYSDGSVKRQQVTDSMVSGMSTSYVTNGVFTKQGSFYVTLKYQGETLMLEYKVHQRVLQSIMLISVNEVNDGIAIKVTGSKLDITGKVVVMAKFNDGTSRMVDVNQCEYSVDGSDYVKVQNNTINFEPGAVGQRQVTFRYSLNDVVATSGALQVNLLNS